MPSRTRTILTHACWRRWVQLLAEVPSRRFKLVANLPYNIATPVLSNLLPASTSRRDGRHDSKGTGGSHRRPALVERLRGLECLDAVPGRRHEIVRLMPPSVFWPMPKVDSAIVRIVVDEERRRASIPIRSFPSVCENDLHPPPEISPGQRGGRPQASSHQGRGGRNSGGNAIFRASPDRATRCPVPAAIDRIGAHKAPDWSL